MIEDKVDKLNTRFQRLEEKIDALTIQLDDSCALICQRPTSFDNEGIYISYFHSKDAYIFVNGDSKMSLIMFLKSSGLLTDSAELRKEFLNIHSFCKGLQSMDVEENLRGLGLFMSSED